MKVLNSPVEIFLRALRQLRDEFMSVLSRSCKRVRAMIEQFELESAELSETLDGGRFEGDDESAGNPEQAGREGD